MTDICTLFNAKYFKYGRSNGGRGSLSSGGSNLRLLLNYLLIHLNYGIHALWRRMAVIVQNSACRSQDFYGGVLLKFHCQSGPFLSKDKQFHL